MLTRRWIPFAILSVPVVVGIAAVLQFDLPVQYMLRYAVHPIQGWLFGASRDTVDSGEVTAEHVSALEEENTELKIQNAQLRSFVQDAGLLQEQIAFLSSKNMRSIQARILSRSFENTEGAFVLNVGSQDNVQAGLAVITGSGACVGIIDTVHDTTSIVRLLSDSTTQLSSVIQNESASQGVITGSHQLTLRMEYIPQSDTVHEGNTVVTSGIDALIPQGLVIGSVASVEKEENALFQEAVIQPLFNPNQLSVLSVVLP